MVYYCSYWMEGFCRGGTVHTINISNTLQDHHKIQNPLCKHSLSYSTVILCVP